MASSERIFLLLDNQERIPEPEVTGSIPDKKAAVSFENVWFSYMEGEWVLKDISLAVRQGETVAIVGPTGAGKSSLIHLLERFYDPTKGRITLGGVDIRQLPKSLLRGRTALITQDVFLFADTIQSNITEGNPVLTRERLQEIIAASNIERLIQRLPDGLDTQLMEGGRTLSGGERQLVAFARALARDPEILILDEATSSVDTQTERLIQEATVRLMQNRTAIVVAHRLSTIRHADRIVVLHRGRIREIGSHDELIAKEGLYYQLYRWQGVS
jgi:ATP-binding cassette subfamily B protein